jgi:O-antigen/teichoic acid export membrane protein
MSIRKLAGETAIYGLSSILGRLLYFLLVPLYVRVFSPSEYGVVTDLFSFVGLMLIFYTYRFETAYFRYSTDKTLEAENVYKTALSSIFFSSLILSSVLFIFQKPIADLFQYPEYSYLIGICAAILAMDAIAEIPLSRLRLESRPLRFASIRLSGIALNIGSNLFFLLLCPWLMAHYSGDITFIRHIYNPEIGIGYIFISNGLASVLQLLMLTPYIKGNIKIPDKILLIKMLRYALPLILVGISFSINELLDRKIMIWLLPGSPDENKATLGAYGACYKLTMIMALFTQAFRYGAEPFFFKQKNEQNATGIYANVAHFYAIFALHGCLFTLLFLDQIKLILHPDYWIALGVIPILLLANLANGLYYNVSIWYRLTDKTLTGAWIAGIGAIITILLNIWWLPIYGFYGAAWATLICYGTMLILCFYLGKKYYPIPYRISGFLFYFFLATLTYGLSAWINSQFYPITWLQITINSSLFCLFLLAISKKEGVTLAMIQSFIKKFSS